MELLIIFVMFMLARSLVELRRRGVPWRHALGPLLLLVGTAAMFASQRFLSWPWPALVGIGFVVPAAGFYVAGFRTRLRERARADALPADESGDPAERLMRQIEREDEEEERLRLRQQARRRGLIVPGVLLLTGAVMGSWPIALAGLIGGTLLEVTTRVVLPRLITGGTRLALAGLLALAGPLSAQTLSGRVVEDEGARPVERALVEVFRIDVRPLATAVTDADGRFRVTVPSPGGVLRVRISTLFHDTVTVDSLRVTADEQRELGDIALRIAPIPLEEVAVDVERSKESPRGREWIRRNQTLGKGTFIAGAVADYAAGRSLGSYIATQTKLWARYDLRGQVSGFVNPGGSISRCVQVLVNRWKIERTNYRSVDQIPREDIAAIEVYQNDRDLPPGYWFDGTPGCGVVNVWLWNSW
jgi:hypothetical protein